MDERRDKCSDDFLQKGRRHRAGKGMLYIQLHACNKIFISRHLYSHPERAGVDYIDHATN